MKFLKTILTYILAFTSGIKKTAEAVNGSADYEEQILTRQFGKSKTPRSGMQGV